MDLKTRSKQAAAIIESSSRTNSYSSRHISRMYLANVSVSIDSPAHCLGGRETGLVECLLVTAGKESTFQTCVQTERDSKMCVPTLAYLLRNR